MPKAYIVPLAAKGFVPTDPITNPVRWAVEDEQGRLLFGGSTWRALADAVAYARRFGFEVPNEA
jgi:hypothetical protein